MHLAPNAVIKRGDQPGTVADLQPGALVKLEFFPGAEREAMVREVSLFLRPPALTQYLPGASPISISIADCLSSKIRAITSVTKSMSIPPTASSLATFKKELTSAWKQASLAAVTKLAP